MTNDLPAGPFDPASDERIALPDIASDGAAHGAGALDWVGMDAIDLPVQSGAAGVQVAASVTAEVDLRAGASRGIHMSRLYLALDQAMSAAPLAPPMLQALLAEFLRAHEGLSRAARVRIAFDHFVRRPALASAHAGWRRYPVTLTATQAGGAFALELAFEVVYSSTCPASTALAKQLVAEDFGRAFPDGSPVDRVAALRWLAGDDGMRATPHSQRSVASVRVLLERGLPSLPLTVLVDRAEDALLTPVQTAVKRIDEQAFARRNGENPMFCEDAARRLQAAFASDPLVRAVHIRVAHLESLHAHDAVAEASWTRPVAVTPQ